MSDLPPALQQALMDGLDPEAPPRYALRGRARAMAAALRWAQQQDRDGPLLDAIAALERASQEGARQGEDRMTVLTPERERVWQQRLAQAHADNEERILAERRLASLVMEDSRRGAFLVGLTVGTVPALVFMALWLFK